MKKDKPTLQELLYLRQLKKPPMFIYQILGYIWKLIFVKKYNVHFNYLVDINKYKGPYIVLSNHASRVDYLYTGVAFLPHRLNYVAGYNEFFRSHLAGVFRLLQVIPKKNFTPEVYSIKEFARIIRKGGKVILFPEGMSSISGSNQPSAIGTGKLIKHFGVPVLMTHIMGGYLTNTKYCLEDRPGRVDVTISQLFTPDDLKTMTDVEIQQKVDEVIHHDDYQYNKTARIAFDGHGRIAQNLHHLLYWCPKCHHEFTMKGEGNTLVCSHCGNGATINEYYDLIPLDKTCIIPSSQTEWFDMERKNAYHAILDEKFEISEHVKLGTLPKYEYLKDLKTSEITGEGTLRFNRSGLHYSGTKDGAPFSFDMATDLLPTYGMCTDVSFFTTYVNGEYYEFFPEHEVTGKWLHVTEEMHRLNGGKWKNFPNVTTYDDSESSSKETPKLL
jgi:1-acyl-sn-glycerol-3-phosphate acyltransferase